MSPQHYENYKRKYGEDAANKARARSRMSKQGYLTERELRERGEVIAQRWAEYYK